MRITLDTNAIIDLEEDRKSAPALRELLELHNSGLIQLCISTIAAAERYRDFENKPDFSIFLSKLAATGLDTIEMLNPPMHWDVTFWDRCVFAEENDPLEPAIKTILFPNDEPTIAPEETERMRRRRINHLCDVLAMWCHIRYGGTVFVTGDSNFHKLGKKRRLIDLGAGQISSAGHALSTVRQTLAT